MLKDLGSYLWTVVSYWWLLFPGIFLGIIGLASYYCEPVKKLIEKKNITKILTPLAILSLLVATFFSYRDVMIKLKNVNDEYEAYKVAQEKTKDAPPAVVSKLDWKPDRQELVMIVLNPSKSEDYVDASIHLGLISYSQNNPLKDQLSWYATKKNNINRGQEPRLFKFKIQIEIDQVTFAIILIKRAKTTNGYELAVWYTWDKGNTWAPWVGDNVLYRVDTDESLKIQNTLDEIRNDLNKYSKDGNHEDYFKKN